MQQGHLHENRPGKKWHKPCLHMCLSEILVIPDTVKRTNNKCTNAMQGTSCILGYLHPCSINYYHVYKWLHCLRGTLEYVEIGLVNVYIKSLLSYNVFNLTSCMYIHVSYGFGCFFPYFIWLIKPASFNHSCSNTIVFTHCSLSL